MKVARQEPWPASGRVKEGAGGKSVAIESIDGVQALESPHFGVFEAQGYERDYLNLAFRGRSTPPRRRLVIWVG